jgi:hypothetical protein
MGKERSVGRERSAWKERLLLRVKVADVIISTAREGRKSLRMN